jgi:glycerol kinase
VTILVIDAGTSSVRAALVADGRVVAEERRAAPPTSPFPGLVEFDPTELARTALELAAQMIEERGPVAAVGIANQRASTVLWERETGRPLGPGLGWQDLRTVGTCLELAAEGIRLAPNQTATKASWLWDQTDPERGADLCVGTVDTWLVWALTEGRHFVTDLTNAATTGLITHDGHGWDEAVAARLRLPLPALPQLVDTSGVLAEATALPGAPPVAALVGDQQASLVGQRCTRPGQAKITFGTGGMLDVCLGPDRPAFDVRGGNGCFPIAAWQVDGKLTWGAEAVILSAGTCVEWLRDDLGLLASAAESHDMAAACADTGGVWFVPALVGLGTPHWDFGARGTLLGVTRGTGRAEITRSVLQGVAQRGADLVDAAEADCGLSIATVRIDGGMSANPTFVQALADATARPVELSPELEATAAGAGLLAGLAVGEWRDLGELADGWDPVRVVEPSGPAYRDEWQAAVQRAEGWIPALSALDF